MAVVASINIELKVTGLGSRDTIGKKLATISGTVEAKSGPHCVIIGDSADNLELGHIVETDLLGVLIISTSGDIGVLVDDDGTGTPSVEAGNMVIDEGEPVWIPLPGGLTDGNYIRIIGSSATAAIEYYLIAINT